jgi:CHRD domain
MKGRRLLLSLVLAAVVALALAGAASAARLDVADHGGRPFSTELTGAAEVPDPGDPNGSGTATITVNLGQEEVCWELLVNDITLPATGAHIHIGAAGVAGDVVVTLTPPVEVVGVDASGFSSGCTTVERELALDILKNPENYYVNVHTSDFEDGAIRGQLS